MTNTIKIHTNTLALLTRRIAPAYINKAVIPILGAALLTWGDQRVSLSLTNLDMQITAHGEADTTGQGSALITMTMLNWICRIAAGSTVELRITKTNGQPRLDVSAGPMKASANLLHDVQDFPQLEAVTDSTCPLTASPAELHRLLNLSKDCISTEETRYYLNGIYLHNEAGKARAVSTDGHRLARIDSDIAWPTSATTSAIIPRMAVAALLRLINPKDNAPISGTLGERFYIFRTDSWEVKGKLIDGHFPDYSRVVPTAEARATITIGKAALAPLLGLGSNFNDFGFDTGAKRAWINCFDLEIEASTDIEASGDAMQIGFNPYYVRDLLQAHPTIKLHMTAPGDAARIVAEDPQALFVLMPRTISRAAIFNAA